MEDRITEGPVYEAVLKIRNEAKRLETGHGYPMVSVRSLYTKLGITNPDLDEVLLSIAEGGFDYCLDHTIYMTGHHEGRGERPDQSVCFWGPDQLRSRLDSLRNIRFRYEELYRP